MIQLPNSPQLGTDLALESQVTRCPRRRSSETRSPVPRVLGTHPFALVSRAVKKDGAVWKRGSSETWLLGPGLLSLFEADAGGSVSGRPASSMDAGARLLQGLVLSKGPSGSLRTELRGGEIKQSAVLGT